MYEIHILKNIFYKDGTEFFIASYLTDYSLK
jgi:hypothetical protein